MDEGGWYYLHTNGSLIHKRLEPEAGSPFVCRIWKCDTTDRGSAWLILIEALALGADKKRIDELAAHWKCDDEDAQHFVENATDKNGQQRFILFRDGDAWCAAFHDFVTVQESQCGFGETALEAFAELSKGGLLQRA